MKENSYRRKEDEDTRLLILLNERMENIQKTTDELVQVQKQNPCQQHDLRLKTLEKVTWIVVTGIILLILKSIFELVLTG